MKKIIALALALVLTLSCVAALADAYDLPDRNMTNTVVDQQESPHFLVTKKSTTAGLENAAMEAQQHTDVWLQVEASGQIDITVPLVAVFKTNIDGGRDVISENYKLINYSSAAIAVTKLEIKDMKANVQTNKSEADKNMELVKQSEVAGKYNKYALIVLPEDQYNIDQPGTGNKRWQLAQDVGDNVSHQTSPLMSTAFTKSGDTFTLDSGAKAGDENLGLWLIERAPNATTGKESKMIMTLETSKLTFVTSKTNKGEASVEDGIKLFTVTYTVKIDDSAKVGEDIYGTTNGTEYNDSTKPATQETHAYEYQGAYVTDKGKQN